jgi:hypothetical protein
VWFTVLIRARWSGGGPVRARAGRASYATYFLHPLVLTAIMVLFAWLARAPELKFLVVAVVAVPVCFLAGYVAQVAGDRLWRGPRDGPRQGAALLPGRGTVMARWPVPRLPQPPGPVSDTGPGPDAAAAAGPRPFDRRVIWAGGVVSAVLMALSPRYGFHRDELYFLDSARHLQASYVDQPVLTPLLAWVSLKLFGLSLPEQQVAGVPGSGPGTVRGRG